MKVKCQECKQERYDSDFYRAIREKKNKEGVYEPYIICKECIIEEYLKYSENNFSKGLLYICDKYNVYYDVNLLNMISMNELPNLKVLFSRYITNISSLRQYINLKFKDSVYTSTKEFNEYLNGKTDDSKKEEKSDIEFINNDIKQLKKNIEKAIQKEDFNSHNKWMNCLRDAIELREKLIQKEIIKSTYDNSIAIGNALKNIKERVMCHDILSKINKITGSVMSNDDFYDILKDISNNWKHLSKETKDDLAKLIAGEKDKSYFMILIDSFSE